MCGSPPRTRRCCCDGSRSGWGLMMAAKRPSDGDPVAVWMPARVWGHLASLAAEQDAQIADLIADAVELLVTPRLDRDRVPAVSRARLALLCQRGLGIEAIAAELGVGVHRVKLWLVQCGLRTKGQARSKKTRAA